MVVNFARLKLRIIANGLRGRPMRIVAFVLGLGFGLGLAGLGFLAFFGSGAGSSDTGLVIATFVGTALVAGWLLLPVLLFGVDETLDPARFALFPLPRRTLAIGMLAAACVGVPGAATLIALLGVAVAGAWRAGLPGAVAGLAGALLGLLLCVVLSRAVTSALANMLRSRRVRDLAAVIVALLGASIGPANLALQATVKHASLAPALRVARILDWTPLAAGFVTPYDIAAGRPMLALARLAIVAATVVLLLWWWSHTLESAMLGGSSVGPARGVVRGGAVAALVPRPLRGIRSGAFAAIVAREVRYWSRDPRRRAALISILFGGGVVPIALAVAGSRHGHSGVPLPIAIAFSGILPATIIGNQFGFDGYAYSTHMLTGVPGRIDLRARASALALIVAPVLLALVIVVGIVIGRGDSVAPAIGTLAASFGCSAACATLLSVLAPYPAPQGRNAFATSSGTGSAKSLLTLGTMIATVPLASPVIVASVLLPGAWRWIVLPIGLAWGLTAVLVATRATGRLLERRAPELLLEVAPGT